MKLNRGYLFEVLKAGFLPFTLGVIFLAVGLLYDQLNLPNSTEIVAIFRQWFNKIGIAVILIGAFFEGMFMLSFYFPGSVIIVMSVLVMGDRLDSLLSIGAMALIGFTVANVINYLLGREGFYRLLVFAGGEQLLKKSKGKVLTRPWSTIFLTSWHPNFLAITVVSSGILRINFWKVMISSFVSLSFWITVWILLLTPFVETIVLRDENNTWLIFAVFAAWAAINMILKAFQLGKQKI